MSARRRALYSRNRSPAEKFGDKWYIYGTKCYANDSFLVVRGVRYGGIGRQSMALTGIHAASAVCRWASSEVRQLVLGELIAVRKGFGRLIL